MDWSEVLNWIIPIIVSCIVTTAIGTALGFLIKHFLTKYFTKIEKERQEKIKKEDAEKAELAKYRKQDEDEKLANLISGAVEKVNKPIIEKVNEIDEKLKQDREATITVLRSKMKTLRDQYKAQGYADSGDKATWNELYKNYQAMGGNYFKEFVDQWKKEVNDLPYELDEEEENQFPISYNYCKKSYGCCKNFS